MPENVESKGDDVTVAVKVRVKVTGQRRRGDGVHDLELPLATGPVGAKQLIEAAVTAEVEAYEARADDATFLRVLTEQSLAADLARGAVRLGDVERPQPVDVRGAVATALLAFEDGIFKVFVGEEELDATSQVDLADGAEVLFPPARPPRRRLTRC